MDSSDLYHARGTIRRSAAVRARLRGQSPDDRDDLLRGCLHDLTVATAPISAGLRRGPLTGRASRHREARAVADSLQRERALVRGMLRRASGGRKPARQPYSRESFRGHVGWARRQATKVEDVLNHALPQMRRGTQEYRQMATVLLDTVDRLQRRLTAKRASAEYWSYRTWGLTRRGDRQKRDETLFTTAEATARDLSKLRQRAKRAVAVPIRVTIASSLPRTLRKPTPAKRRRWSQEDAWEALVAFTQTHGRPPKASEFPGDPTLPSYAKVHALFGGLPEARDLRYDADRLV